MSTGPDGAPGRGWPLVGRAAELDDLEELLSRACDGPGGAVLLEGEAGVGKSTLVHALVSGASLLGIDARTTTTTTTAAHGSTAASDSTPGSTAASTTDPTAASIPEPVAEPVTEPATVPASASPGTASPATASAAEALAASLRREPAERPRVVVCEDLHAADGDLLRVLREAGGVGAVPGVLVVLTLRPVPHRPEVTEVVTSWTRAGARHVGLGPLPPAAAGELAEAIIGASIGPSLRGAVATAGGNPRFVVDVVVTARDEGALGAVEGGVDAVESQWRAVLEETVRARVAYLGDDVLALLANASVLGVSFVVVDLARLAGRPVPEVWRTLRHALAAGVVQARGDRLVFRHDVVRAALYGGIPAPARATMHARAAWTLREAGAPHAVVAAHLERAR
ncbi:AAA family ATPase [Cellulomonas composti]|uniref:Orc1-like AAA ATPase domain-containing protein n=1 Tax=Cellulomonas composti TaxID=266130 RepID=A0A511JC35_9CELL|nr:ATP-binding protein [Cellulomonas composti]GEL95273.1 hypothetical protein CCO02nite_19310 [Cellulomonas composti]